MARERLVTRTITNTTAHIMRVDTKTASVSTVEIEVGGLTDNAEILKYVQKNHDTETVKHIAVTGATVTEKIYAMTEVDFLKYARVLDKR